MELEIGQKTDAGRVRRHNEDWLERYVPAHPWQRASKGAIFAVADGMGGRPGGREASRLAVQALITEYYRNPSMDTVATLIGAVQRANAWIYGRGVYDAHYRGMATTLVAAVVRDDELFVAHVGDSRAYLIRGHNIWQLTQDHSWVGEQVVAGVLTPAEARRHPYRYIITRALGSQPDVEVGFMWVKLQLGDAVLLCSDGLSDKVGAAEMREVIARSKPQRAVERLVALANRRGGEDNISAITFRVGKQRHRTGAVRPASYPSRHRQAAVRRKPIAGSPSVFVVMLQLAGGLLVATMFIVLMMCLLASSGHGLG